LDQAATRQIQQPKNVFMASLLALLIPLQVQCADSHHDQLNTNYTSAEEMSTMWQVSFLPASQANHEGNLKNGRTYLQ